MLKYGIVLSALVAVGLAVVCPPQGLYRTKSSTGCRDYVQCNNGASTVGTCSGFLKAFDPVLLECNWCWSVNCSAPATPWPAPTTPKPTQPPTPAPTKATPAPTKATPAPTKATPAPTKATPAPTKATPAPTKATPAPTKATPAPTKATPAPTKAPTPTVATPAQKVTSAKAAAVSQAAQKNVVNEATPKPLDWWGKVKNFFG